MLSLPKRAGSPAIRAVFFDLDGTLVNAAGVVSAAARESLAALQQAGISVGFATGRPLFACQDLIAELGIASPSLFFSGSLLIEPLQGRILAQTPIDREALIAVIDGAREANLYLELYTKENLFVHGHDGLADMHFVYLKRYPVCCDLKALSSAETIIKAVLISGDPEAERRMRELCLKLTGIHAAYSTGASHPQVVFGNLTSPLCSRDRAFEVLIADLKVSAAEVAAFGDAEADLPFLKLAGCGVAMGNAPESVRRGARHVTKSVEEDGVPYALTALGILS